MRQATRHYDPCAICHHNNAWRSRHLEICGECARDILTLMEPEVEHRVKKEAEARTAEISYQLRLKEQHIRYLKSMIDRANTTKRPPATEGVVYYLRSGAYIKIGWTSDLDKRMRAYAPDSVLLAVEPGTRKDEQRRHKMFAAHRTHGREWYALVPSLTHHIEQTIAKHGQPDPVTFAAQPVTIPQPRPKEYVQARDYRARRTA